VQKADFVAKNAPFLTKLAPPPIPVPPPVTLTGIAVRPNFYQLRVGSKVRLTAIATYSDGSVKDVGATWKANNKNVAVDALGVAVGKRQGSSTVTATFEGKQAASTLMVRRRWF
jgi:uncharacterized protein YjdB